MVLLGECLLFSVEVEVFLLQFLVLPVESADLLLQLSLLLRLGLEFVHELFVILLETGQF